jgi:hypothetical protein
MVQGPNDYGSKQALNQFLRLHIAAHLESLQHWNNDQFFCIIQLIEYCNIDFKTIGI